MGNDKRVAFDLDDVLLDFVGGLRAAVKTEFGVEIPDSAINDFNLRPVLDPIIGENWWTWLRRRDWLWSGFPAMDGAIGVLERLRREGYYLEIVTSKPEWADYAVWKWLGKWRPPVQRVTITRHGEVKANFTDANVLVDDKWDNCLEWVISRPGRTALLFDRPHNKGETTLAFDASDPVGCIIRVKGWQETYDKIKELTDV